MTNMPTRDDILRIGITKNQKIIEIGPSYNPLTPKAEGWHSYVVDHADRAGLIEKYRTDPAVNVAKIENVDFVWTEGPLADAVSPEHHGTFDIFIACHVLEHVPDLIGILRSAEALCRPEAKMILALPDKRVCFDFYSPSLYYRRDPRGALARTIPAHREIIMGYLCLQCDEAWRAGMGTRRPGAPKAHLLTA
jgi:SAM-dependent methyltransferase